MSQAHNNIEAEISALTDLGRKELAQRWMTAHGGQPPKGIRHDLLIRSAAWQVQAKRFGGLSPATRRALKAAIVEVEQTTRSLRVDLVTASRCGSPGQDQTSRSHRTQPAPGARLVRDWNGKRHVIDVLETGFVFEAKVYNSLTAIARQITGAHWSGPRFFGL